MIDKDAVKEMIRAYIENILLDGEALNDALHGLTELGVSQYVVNIVHLIGFMLSMIGGF